MARRKRKPDIQNGFILPTLKYGNILILNDDHRDRIRVQFLNTGWVTHCTAGNIRAGTIKDVMQPVVFRVGFIGDGPHMANPNGVPNPVYWVWHDMLERCYANRNYGRFIYYRDVKVDPVWFNYQIFADWYVNQISEFKDVDFKWHIDKDLKFPGNRFYSPNTCYVLPSAINTLLGKCEPKSSDLPIGVTKVRHRYHAHCAVRNKSHRYIGSYKTVAEAQIAYWLAKFEVIHQTATKYQPYLPEPLAMRLMNFGWQDAVDYYGEDAYLRV